MIKLNEEQLRAIEECSNFILHGNPEEWYVIQGLAGVGKTTLAEELIKKFKGKTTVVAALSHKAKNVIREKFIKARVPASFHSIAGILNQEIDLETGKFLSKRKGNSPLKNADILLIDEGSMINEEILEEIFKRKLEKTKVIFLGDIGQLPPIRTKDNPYYKDKTELMGKKSPVFLTKNKSLLTTRVRQTLGNPLLEFSDLFWTDQDNDNWIPSFVSEDRILNDSGIKFIKDFDEEILLKFKESVITKNPDRIKLVCYKNDTRRSYNSMIHNYLFGNDNEMKEGEMIIFNSPYGEIENSTESPLYDISERIFMDDVGLKYKTGYVNFNGMKTYIRFLLQESLSLYKTIISEKFKIAYENKETPKYLNLLRSAWEFKERYPDIDYGYAISSHKSQGSSYDDVIVHLQDILSVGPINNRQKCESIYTALTRARKTAYIL